MDYRIMKHLLLLLFALLPVCIFAQTMGSVKGLVSDSTHDYGLQSATVTVYKKADSVLVNYQVTNNQGEFNISDLPTKTPLLISVTYSGYYDFSKEIFLDSLKKDFDFKKISMLRDTTRQMDEVIIKSVVPVRMNGDTLEINPGAFKLDSSAVVEDMLLRVPGVTMWSDGSITVNGKKVNNVYVDGKPFFGNNPELATQNLPKNAIEKIQVYREMDYGKQDLTNTDLDSTLTMNIKMRPDKKKGYFGKLSAGIGTDKRYEGDLTLQAYNKKTKIGIAGNINNTNKTVEGVQAALENNTFRSYNRRNFGAPNANASGLNTVHYFGATFQHSFDESTNTRFDNRLNGNYDLRNTKTNVNTIGTNIQNLNNRKLITQSDRNNNSTNLYQSVSTGYQNRKRATAFSLNANYNWTQSSNASEGHTEAFRNDTVASKAVNRSSGKNRSENFSLSGYFNNNDYDEGINKKSFSTNYSVNYNSQHNNSDEFRVFESLIDSIYTEKRERKYQRDNSNFSANLGLNYNGLRSLLFGSYNFWNINIGLRNNFRYNKSDLNSQVWELDTLTHEYHINKALTNVNSVFNVENRPGISFFKTVNKNLTDRYYKSLTFRVDLQDQMVYQRNTSSLSYRNIERTYNFFTPSSSINYNYNKFNQYNLNFGLNQNSSATAPTIDQLYPIVDDINKYNIVVGNPNLRSSYGYSYNFSANYNTQKFNETKTYTAGLNMGYNTLRDGISDSSVYGGNGSRTAYLININNRRSFNGSVNGSASFRMKKNMLQVRYNGSMNTAQSPQFIQTPDDLVAVESVSKNLNFNHSLNIFYSVLEIFNVTIGQSISNNSSRQLVNNVEKLSNRAKTYGTRANFNLTVPKDLTISSNISYLNNISATGQSVKATIWNAYATYRFMKMKQAEVKFSVFDLLRQNKNINNFANANAVGTSITNGLQQFYMLSLSYYPRQFGGRAGRGNRSGSPRRMEPGNRNQSRPAGNGGGMRPGGGGVGRNRGNPN